MNEPGQDKIVTDHDRMIARYSYLPVLSATQIKMYKQCRLLYKYNYRDRNAQSQHIASVLGSALHAAIELHLKTGVHPLMTFSNTFDAKVDQYAAAGSLKKFEKIQELKAVGIEIIQKIDWPALQPRDLQSIEMRFTLPFPNKRKPITLITGVMDLITPDGTIIDHKSSSKLPSARELENDPQFILYHWAYKELYRKPPQHVVWHHLRTGKLANTLVEQNFKDKLASVVAIVNDMLIEEDYPKKEKKDGFCMFVCDYNTSCWPTGFGR